MRKKKEANSVHDKAIALCEGRPIQIMGHTVKLFKNKYMENPCMECEMDSICRMEMTDVCAECYAITRIPCYLQLIVQV